MALAVFLFSIHSYIYYCCCLLTQERVEKFGWIDLTEWDFKFFFPLFELKNKIKSWRKGFVYIYFLNKWERENENKDISCNKTKREREREKKKQNCGFVFNLIFLIKFFVSVSASNNVRKPEKKNSQYS
jgi:hypothetical protein